MKKNDWFILASTIAYTYLFYSQSPGINFFLFSVLLVLLSATQNINLIKERSWLGAAAGTLISGFGVFYLGSALPITANLISLFLLAAFSINPNSSVFISLLNSCYSIAATIPLSIVRLTTTGTNTDTRGPSKGKKFILFMVPLFASLIFFLLYRASNPLFEKVTNEININFISVDWILFLFTGFVLMTAFFYHRHITAMKDADEKNGDILNFVSEEDHQNSWVTGIMSQPSELFTGVSLFALLNILLLSVNGIDVYYLYILQHLPDDLTLSEYLHDGTNALIFSIILAIAILMFYFRGRLNFINDNKVIRALAYGWIAQNIFLIVTTAKRNWFYVSNFGLTHKRIGVYVFLALCVIGLITTFIKVYQVKSGWFLFRKNTWVWYCVLVAACPVNWDALIASQNLTLAKEKNTTADISYLNSLDYSALSYLFELYAAEQRQGREARSFTPILLETMYGRFYNLRDETQKADWQSSCLAKIQSKKKIETLIAEQQLSLGIKQ